MRGGGNEEKIVSLRRALAHLSTHLLSLALPQSKGWLVVSTPSSVRCICLLLVVAGKPLNLQHKFLFAILSVCDFRVRFFLGAQLSCSMKEELLAS